MWEPFFHGNLYPDPFKAGKGDSIVSHVDEFKAPPNNDPDAIDIVRNKALPQAFPGARVSLTKSFPSVFLSTAPTIPIEAMNRGNSCYHVRLLCEESIYH